MSHDASVTAAEPLRSPSGVLIESRPGGFAGFELLAEVGRGAAATVYRCRPGAGHPRAGTEFALKLLDHGAGTESAVAFRREAALLATVDHPGLPRIHEVGTADGRAYLVMDLVDGEPLTAVLARGRLGPERTVAIAIDLVEPLAAVHRTSVVHRDIKPDNIIVRPDGTARLIDFGLAARETGQRAEAAVGTLAYCPPEQSGMLRRPVCNRSDLYSLGAVLFECLAGRPPFPTHDVSELLRMHAVAPVPDLRRLAGGVSDALVDIVTTLLAKDPDDRYQTGEELLADLRRLSADPAVALTIRTDRAAPQATRPDQIRPLVGRATELARLSGPWVAARAGTGGVCVVRGGPGAGKSRLVTELTRLAGAGNALVLRGKSSVDDAVPLVPLRDALDACLRDVERLPASERTAVHDRVRSCAGDAVNLLGNLGPALARVLGSNRATDAEPGRGDGERQDQFTLAVVGFLTALAHEFGALMLVLDDVQWLDPGTRRVLARLANDLRDAPVLVVCTARDDPDSATATGQLTAALPGAVDLDLTVGPLSEAGTAELVASLVPGIPVDARLVRLISARGKGNPFVVQEYLRAVVDAGLLRPSWGAWLLDEGGLDELELPQDALGLVLTRVGGLGPEVRELLGTAATVGNRFRPDLVAGVHRVDLSVVLAAMLEASGRGLVEARPGGEYAFLHDRIREALLDPGGAAELHARIAAVLGAALPPPDGHPAEHTFAVAHHYLAAGDRAGAEPARLACRAAGELALRTFAPAQAVTLLEHSLALTPEPDAELLVGLGTALRDSGDYGRAEQLLVRALGKTADPAGRAAIYARLAGVHRAVWALDEAHAAVENGLAELGARLPRNRLLLALSTLLMFVTGVLVRTTGLGHGTLTGAARDRAETIAALHEAGSYVSVLSMRSAMIMMHNLRVLFWAHRLGTGEAFARGLCGYAFMCANLGLRRTAVRNFARIEADPAMANAGVRAIVRHYRGASLFLGYLDDGDAWKRAIEDDGRWLDLAAYSDATAIFSAEGALWGRTTEATQWWDQGRRRLALNLGEPTSLLVVPPMIAALQGRPADAAAALHRMAEIRKARPSTGTGVLLAMAELSVLVEQNETGAPFDRAVAEFAALKRIQPTMIRTHRVIHHLVARGRLAQVRAAGADDRPVRLAQARAAVRALRVSRGHPLFVARERIARADLLLLDGKPRRALRILDRTRPLGPPDAPSLAFDAARVRARALHAIGGAGDGDRQALLATAIAEHEGWPHRAAQVAAEFPGVRRRHTATMTSGSIVDLGVGTPGRFPAHVDIAAVERQRLRALEEVGNAASRVLDPAELARIALDETIRILRADRAFLFLSTVDGDGLAPHLGRAADGTDLDELTGYSASLVERVRETREPLVVTGTDEGAALGAQSAVLHGLRSIMVAPLRLEDRLLGVVYLDSQVAKGIFTAEDAGILIALTNHVATSLETARAAQLEISMRTAQRQRETAEQLRAAFEWMSDTLDPDAILARLVRSARTLVGADRGWLVGWDATGGCVLTESGFYGESKRAVAADVTTRDLLARTEPAAGPGVVVPSAITDRMPAARSWLVVPLRSRTTTVGAMVLGSPAPDGVATHIEVVSALVAQGLTAYDNASLFARVQNLAVVDELTGIANRRRFLESAERELAGVTRSGRPLAAMMVDIDHFKRINDTYGHPTGDDVIRTVAARLVEHGRRTDLVGRYGGEEFALVLPDTPLRTCRELAERLRAGIADLTVDTRSGPLQVTVSIGFTTLMPADGDVETLLARADQFLYEAKNAGRNRVHGT